MSNIKRLIRTLAHLGQRARARRAGLGIDAGAYVSRFGIYQIDPSARVEVAKGASLAFRHFITAHAGSEIILGQNVHFEDGARILALKGAKIHIADGCWFNHDATIMAAERVEIGRKTLFAPQCCIIDNNHGTDREEIIMDQPCESEPVIVGEGAWLGVGATLLLGARVGDGAVIAARSVVNKSVPAYEIWGGVPAKRISERRSRATADTAENPPSSNPSSDWPVDTPMRSGQKEP